MQNAGCVSSLARQIPACPGYSVLLSSLDILCHLFTLAFDKKGSLLMARGLEVDDF